MEAGFGRRAADRHRQVFVKHGYAPPVELIHHLKDAGMERALVCGIQADTC